MYSPDTQSVDPPSRHVPSVLHPHNPHNPRSEFAPMSVASHSPISTRCVSVVRLFAFAVRRGLGSLAGGDGITSGIDDPLLYQVSSVCKMVRYTILKVVVAIDYSTWKGQSGVWGCGEKKARFSGERGRVRVRVGGARVGTGVVWWRSKPLCDSRLALLCTSLACPDLWSVPVLSYPVLSYPILSCAVPSQSIP